MLARRKERKKRRRKNEIGKSEVEERRKGRLMKKEEGYFLQDYDKLKDKIMVNHGFVPLKRSSFFFIVFFRRFEEINSRHFENSDTV